MLCFSFSMSYHNTDEFIKRVYCCNLFGPVLSTVRVYVLRVNDYEVNTALHDVVMLKVRSVAYA